MPVTSFFIPKESLQGAEVPAHIRWKDICYDSIRAEVPGQLKIKRLFNVAKDDWRRESFGFVVKKVEVEGYLGMVLGSRKLETESFDVWVDFSFIKDEKMVEKESHRVHLFRPRIIVNGVPDTIKVNVEKNLVLNRIKIRNLGEGTVIILVKTKRDSEIRKKLPASVLRFREQYFEDLKKNVEILEEKYPEQLSVISGYLDAISPLLTRKRGEYRYYRRIRSVLEKIVRALERDEEFKKAFIGALGDAYIKNLRLVTIFDNFLDYMNSIVSTRVLIPDPLWVFPVSNEPRKLSLKIYTTDLMLSKYPPIEVSGVKLVGNDNGEIPIYRIFEWG